MMRSPAEGLPLQAEVLSIGPSSLACQVRPWKSETISETALTLRTIIVKPPLRGARLDRGF